MATSCCITEPRLLQLDKPGSAGIECAQVGGAPTMSAHMYNLNAPEPENILICSICYNFQEVPPPSNSVKVRFCLMDWPYLKCEACCRCRICKYACWVKLLDTFAYGFMMNLAVHNYLNLLDDDFEGACSIDLGD